MESRQFMVPIKMDSDKKRIFPIGSRFIQDLVPNSLHEYAKHMESGKPMVPIKMDSDKKRIFPIGGGFL